MRIPRTSSRSEAFRGAEVDHTAAGMIVRPATGNLPVQIPTMVEGLIGLPYRLYGRDHARGIDCFGAVRAVYREEVGVQLPDIRPGGDFGIADFMKAWIEVDEPNRLFDLIYFRKGGEDAVCVVVSRKHALTARRMVGVHLARIDMLKRVPGVKFYRLRQDAIG